MQQIQSEEQRVVRLGTSWFKERGWEPFAFQLEAWKAYCNGSGGIVTAPTGYGKTYSLCIPALASAGSRMAVGLKVIWITPIRALAKEIKLSWERAAAGLNIDWTIAIRTGDTGSTARKKMRDSPPDVLVTTPESLHVMLATKGYPRLFSALEAVICDEWHELVGSKRGVLLELALSRLRALRPGLRTWGISATIGNIDEAMDVLFGTYRSDTQPVLVKGDHDKDIDLFSVVPDDIESFPWAGYYGLKMVDKVVEIIKRSQSTIIFTNTRAMCERWYHALLEAAPALAGQLAMHHGSIARNIREWVEQALYDGKLKVVVSTSSLDLGVDFRPVETVVQIGSPKGVARCMQRAGRSGHSPGALSTIYFVPTHALELLEAAALRSAIKDGHIESRMPYVRSFDVLVQYLVTLAVSEGFRAEKIYEEIRTTHCFASISEDEWRWALNFIVNGGDSLDAYDEYKKVVAEKGVFKVTDRGIALKHRLSIGTIVGDNSFKVKYMSGKNLGTIEEYFVSRLKPGDVFWFAGRSLEFIRVKDNAALVKRTKKKAGITPAWQGSRMSLSSQLSFALRSKVVEYPLYGPRDKELDELQPLFALQEQYSHIPSTRQFLIEKYKGKEGYRVIMFPFEGRFVHEGMATLIAYRLGQRQPISFSMGMNDYGFELLSDKPIPIEEALDGNLFDVMNLEEDIQRSINGVEMAKRKFYEISRISGLIFQGYPGKPKKSRHLQTSTGLIFEVFKQYDGQNLLFLQAYDEAMYFELEKIRMREALERIRNQEIIITEPGKFTPFALPIIADSLRERMTTEKLEDRLQKMKLDLING